MKFKYQDLEFGLDFQPELGLADSGDLDTDLAALLILIGEAAAERGTAAALFIDEIQYVAEEELAALISGFHQANQAQVPITMVAAGLPQIVGQTGKAKSYAERLFEFTPVDRLDPTAARAALCVPAENENVRLMKQRFQKYSGKPLGTRTFFRSGASTVGMWPIPPRLAPMMRR